MAQNFGQLTTYVSKRLIDPSNTAVAITDVQQGINQSIAYWKLRRFWFNESAEIVTLTAQNPTIPLTANYLCPSIQDDGFNILYGNVKYPLVKVDIATMDSLYLSNGYGLPRWYARMASNEYQVYPIPDQNYTTDLYQLNDYPDLVNNSDSNDFTNNAERLIACWALANLVSELRQDTPGSGDYYRQAAQDEYRNLRVLTNKKNAAGKLTLYSTLNNRGFR
jgi:hypothetical protein